MISLLKFGIVALTMFVSTPGQSALTQCRPAANCAASDTPCTQWIHQGGPEILTPGPAAGAGVIRVRLCKDGDSLCSSGEGQSQQTVSVFGYSGDEQIYSRVLNTQGTIDTGPYTRLAGLTRLSVRCNSTSSAYCKIIWQVCREELPIVGSPFIGEIQRQPTKGTAATQTYSK